MTQPDLKKLYPEKIFRLFDRLSCEEIIEAVSVAKYDRLFLLINLKRCEIFFQETEGYYRERFFND